MREVVNQRLIFGRLQLSLAGVTDGSTGRALWQTGSGNVLRRI